MPSEEVNRYLIDHFIARELFPCQRVGRGHDLGCEVVGRSACCAFCHAIIGQFFRQGTDFGAGLFRAVALEQMHPLGEFEKARDIHQRLRALIITEVFEHAFGIIIGNRDGKERAEDNVCGQF